MVYTADSIRDSIRTKKTIRRSLVSRHIMKRTLPLVLKAKALKDVVGIGHLAYTGTDSFALGFGICGFTASALWRIPLGAMASVTF